MKGSHLYLKLKLRNSLVGNSNYRSKRTSLKDYEPIKKKVESMKDVTTRPMFGYQCFSIKKKFFVGFSNKNKQHVIVRLPKDQQKIAVKLKAIKPFSHGAKMGWIEIDSAYISSSSMAMKWIVLAYENARNLAKKS